MSGRAAALQVISPFRVVIPFHTVPCQMYNGCSSCIGCSGGLSHRTVDAPAAEAKFEVSEVAKHA